jgi:peptidoglycan hydrolase-like protein with peptidoglycan-binding domain
VPSGVVVLVGVALLAVGGLTGLVLAPVAVPAPIQGADDPGVVEVRTEEFADERPVELTVEFGPQEQLFAPVAGIVTGVSCAPGGEVESGAAPLSVDGEPIVALATPVPLWRDLTAGVTGPDVEGLQEELERLGFDLPRTGRYDHLTRLAVADLFARHGVADGYGPLRLSSVMWLPGGSPVIESCEVRLGSRVSPGTAIVSFEPAVEAVRLDAPPVDAQPGERLVVVDGVELPLTGDGAVTDPEALDALKRTDAFALFRQTGGDVPIGGAYRLAEPLTVTGVPPGAIVAGSGDTGCVVAGDGAAHRVRVVSSVAGRTLVEWLDIDDLGAPSSIRVDPGDGRPCG